MRVERIVVFFSMYDWKKEKMNKVCSLYHLTSEGIRIAEKERAGEEILKYIETYVTSNNMKIVAVT